MASGLFGWRVSGAAVALVGLGLAAPVGAIDAGAAPAPPPTYIVAVADGVDPARAAKRLGVTPTLVYRDALNGYAAPLSSAQRNMVSSDAATLSVEADVVLGRTPKGDVPDDPPQPVQLVTKGVERIGSLASPTARIDGGRRAERRRRRGDR